MWQSILKNYTGIQFIIKLYIVFITLALKTLSNRNLCQGVIWYGTHACGILN
jgi:hypothetical protein